jgi:hypothetical protein
MLSKADATPCTLAGKLDSADVRQRHFGAKKAVTTIESRSVNVENKWVFEQDNEQQWRWVHLTGEAHERQSSEAFRKPMDCVLDAVRHAVKRRKAMSDTELL